MDDELNSIICDYYGIIPDTYIASYNSLAQSQQDQISLTVGQMMFQKRFNFAKMQ
jgi:hypothetical protein